MVDHHLPVGDEINQGQHLKSRTRMKTKRNRSTSHLVIVCSGGLKYTVYSLSTSGDHGARES